MLIYVNIWLIYGYYMVITWLMMVNNMVIIWLIYGIIWFIIRKMMDFVSWDDDIPNMMGKWNACSKPPTRYDGHDGNYVELVWTIYVEIHVEYTSDMSNALKLWKIVVIWRLSAYIRIQVSKNTCQQPWHFRDLQQIVTTTARIPSHNPSEDKLLVVGGFTQNIVLAASPITSPLNIHNYPIRIHIPWKTSC